MKCDIAIHGREKMDESGALRLITLAVDSGPQASFSTKMTCSTGMATENAG